MGHIGMAEERDEVDEWVELDILYRQVEEMGTPQCPWAGSRASHLRSFASYACRIACWRDGRVIEVKGIA